MLRFVTGPFWHVGHRRRHGIGQRLHARVEQRDRRLVGPRHDVGVLLRLHAARPRLVDRLRPRQHDVRAADAEVVARDAVEVRHLVEQLRVADLDRRDRDVGELAVGAAARPVDAVHRALVTVLATFDLHVAAGRACAALHPRHATADHDHCDHGIRKRARLHVLPPSKPIERGDLTSCRGVCERRTIPPSLRTRRGRAGAAWPAARWPAAARPR